MGELRCKLLEREDKPKRVDDAIAKDDCLDRENILDKVHRETKNDSRLPNLPSIFKKHWKTMIEEDSRLRPVFSKPPMACYSRGRNIREQLCTAKLPPPRSNLRQQEDGFGRCKRSGCRLCPFTGLKHWELGNTEVLQGTCNWEGAAN